MISPEIIICSEQIFIRSLFVLPTAHRFPLNIRLLLHLPAGLDFIVLLFGNLYESFRFGRSRGQDHFLEHTHRHLEQIVWRSELDGFARIHHQYPVRVHDGVQPMGDRQHGAVGELDTDCLLDQPVGAGRKVDLN